MKKEHSCLYINRVKGLRRLCTVLLIFSIPIFPSIVENPQIRIGMLHINNIMPIKYLVAFKE